MASLFVNKHILTAIAFRQGIIKICVLLNQGNAVTTNPSDQVPKSPERLAEEFRVDPSVPYSDVYTSQHRCKDHSCLQNQTADLADPLVAFTPNLLAHTDSRPDVTSVPDQEAPGTAPDDLGVYEIASLEVPSETASQDTEDKDTANTTRISEAYGLHESVLMSGEYTESSLDLNKEGEKPRNILVVTNRRLIQIGEVSRQGSMSFIAIRDVNSAVIQPEHRGYRGYIWGALSLFIAAILWTNWNQPIGSVVLPIIVVAMGIYLVLDHILSARNLVVSFHSGSYSITGKVGEHISSENLTAFVNRIFELKERD
jgi:hypothetical protein